MFGEISKAQSKDPIERECIAKLLSSEDASVVVNKVDG